MRGVGIQRQLPPSSVDLAWALACVILLPAAAASQTLDDTVQFISDMANTHGFVRSLSCRNPKAGKPDENYRDLQCDSHGDQTRHGRAQSRT